MNDRRGLCYGKGSLYAGNCDPCVEVCRLACFKACAALVKRLDLCVLLLFCLVSRILCGILCAVSDSGQLLALLCLVKNIFDILGFFKKGVKDFAFCCFGLDADLLQTRVQLILCQFQKFFVFHCVNLLSHMLEMITRAISSRLLLF